MYANLLGQKAYYHLTDADMGKIIGVSRNTFSQKLHSGKFWPNECRAYCEYFNKSFDYLFADEQDEKQIEIDTKMVSMILCQEITKALDNLLRN